MGPVAGTALWALAFYLGFSPLADRLIDRCYRWLQTLGPSRLTPRRDAQTAALASLASLVPFLILAGLVYYGLTVSLGGSWAVSTGLLACMGSGVYELGRRDGQASG